MEIISIFGTNIYNTTLEETVDIVDEYLKGDSLKVIFTPNTEIVMAAKEDENIRNIINEADLIIPDGIGLIYGSKMQKKPLKERVTGFDTSMEMLKLADEYGYSIYLLGGEEGIAEKAGKAIERDYPNVDVVGYHHGFFKGSHLGIEDSPEEDKIIEEINKVKPDIIFVGLGFPRQELFIHANKDRIDGKVIIGNGGVMDILAGEAKRAPEIFQKLGLEWFYRLITEPSRIKRQMALPKFMFQIMSDKEAVKKVQ